MSRQVKCDACGEVVEHSKASLPGEWGTLRQTQNHTERCDELCEACTKRVRTLMEEILEKHQKKGPTP